MIQRQKSAWKNFFIIGMLFTAWFLWAVAGRRVRHAVLFPEEISMEEDLCIQTSTHFRFQDRFQKTLQTYAEFGQMYQDEFSTAVPGLEYTGIGSSYSRQMVPQGICIAGDYMLITAYDKGTHGHSNPSVIYILSNGQTGAREFLTTLVLPDRNHVGGITFDGEYIWIAKSTTGYVSGISYDKIEEAVRSGESSYALGTYSLQLQVGVTASFISFGNDRLWVGTFVSGLGKKGTLCGYRIRNKNGTPYAEKEFTLPIPAHAQGITFFNRSEKTYMALTSSYGMFFDSGVYLYELSENNDGISLLLTGVHRFPPMAQELVSDGTRTYFLFESAASCYSTANYLKCTYPVDRVCGIENERLFATVTLP